MADRSPVSPDDIDFRRLGPDLCDILLRGRHAGTLERIPDLAGETRRHAFRISLLSDPEAPRTFRTIDRPRRTIAGIVNAISNTAEPPPVYLQFHICEHRRGPDEIRSHLIRRDRFLDPDKADAYFDLVQARLQPGEFVVLRLSGKNLRLVHANAAAARLLLPAILPPAGPAPASTLISSEAIHDHRLRTAHHGTATAKTPAPAHR